MGFDFYVPTKVLFGAGQLNNLNIQQMPGQKAMVIISNGKSTKNNGSLARLEEQLKLAGKEYAVFDRIQANPLKSTVMEGGQFARDNGCDFIVALGGGSVMDASKAIAMVATNEGDLWNYVDGGSGKGMKLANKPLPIVAITTTAGTGSEVDQWGVVTHDENNEKIGVGGLDELFPVLSIVDPELMVTVPPKFTAFQGFDALFHSVEGYISRFANLMGDMVQLTAIEAIGTYLPRAVENGADLEAREKLAFANTLSGYSMVVGSCTSEHSLEHAMSAYHHDLPHGAGLIMISRAYYTHFIERHVCDERFVTLAKALGMKEAEKPEDFITALMRLQKECGVADLKMSDYGITPDEFETLARNAMDTMGRLFDCDRERLTLDDCVKIYKESFR